MGKNEQDIFIGRRWAVGVKLIKAINAHKNHDGRITKLEFRRLSWLRWYCLLEFKHKDKDNEDKNGDTP